MLIHTLVSTPLKFLGIIEHMASSVPNYSLTVLSITPVSTTVTQVAELYHTCGELLSETRQKTLKSHRTVAMTDRCKRPLNAQAGHTTVRVTCSLDSLQVRGRVQLPWGFVPSLKDNDNVCFVYLVLDFIERKKCSKTKHCDLALKSTKPKYLASLVALDRGVVYMVLSHEQNKQRSLEMKRLFKGQSPNGFKLQSEGKGSCITLK